MKHTPLPWEVDTGNTVGHIKSISTNNKKMPDGSLSTPTVAKYDIGVNIGYRLRPEEEQKANAELIVKAVNCHYELLKALEEYVAEWDYNYEFDSHITGIITPPESYHMAREAIAKAKGE